MDNGIDLYVFWLGLGGMLALGAGMMYLLLLAAYSKPHYDRGYTVCESVKRAIGELQ